MSHPPVFVGLFVLEAIALVASGLSLFGMGIAAVIFSLVWIVVFALATGGGLQSNRRGGKTTPGAQKLQLLGITIGTVLWWALMGTSGLLIGFALSVLAMHTAFMASRRELYFALVIVLTVFYDAVGNEELPYRWWLGAVFLAALLFVLIADYTDRRLAYVRVGDRREFGAVLPGVRNAAFATAFVAAVAAVFYLVLPQPEALNLGFPAGGPPLAQLGSSDRTGRPEKQGGGSGKAMQAKGDTEMKTGEGRGGGGGPGQGSGSGGSAGRLGAGQGAGGGPGSGAGGVSPGKDLPGPIDKPGPFPGGRWPSDRGGPPTAPDKLDLAGDQPPSDKDDGKKDPSKGRDKDKGKEGDKDKDEEDSKDRSEDKKDKSDPQPPDALVLFYMDADRPLYLRTHAYVWALSDGWAENSRKELPSPSGKFLRADPSPATGVAQRYKIAQDLDDRIAAAYAPIVIEIPPGTLYVSRDLALRSGQRLVRDSEYRIVSDVLYAGARPSAQREGRPPPEYMALPPYFTPRTDALAHEITAAHQQTADKADALERYLRTQYSQGIFLPPPGTHDPTHAFLFEQRKGGSRQFAGALAVMLRAAGIPSRIVSGYRARRLNPLHGTYEIWRHDRHYWTEAYVEGAWAAYEPSPWATLPAKSKPATAFEAAREYVRLAQEPPPIEGAPRPGLPPPEPRVDPWYLYWVLVWGWFATYGTLLLVGTVAAGIATWHWRWWTRPVRDAYDRFRLRHPPRGEPDELVRAGYARIERVCARRGYPRERLENHAEFLVRLAEAKPHLREFCGTLNEKFAAARYGPAAITADDARRALHASSIIAELIDENPA